MIKFTLVNLFVLFYIICITYIIYIYNIYIILFLQIISDPRLCFELAPEADFTKHFMPKRYYQKSVPQNLQERDMESVCI